MSSLLGRRLILCRLNTSQLCFTFCKLFSLWFFFGLCFFFLIFIFTLFYFTLLYWFCYTLTWIRHGCTWVPNPEPPSHLFNDSVQFSSVAQSCLTLFDLMDCSTPGFSAHHWFPELVQTHVHWVGNAIQPSHPVIPFYSYPQSLPASGSFQMSQPFTSGVQSIGVSGSASVLFFKF